MTQTASIANGPAPVMDVVAPPVEKAEVKESPTPATQTQDSNVDPVDQLAADDQKSQLSLAEGQSKHAAQPQQKKAPVKSQDTTHTGGVTLAITATVIIVLSLAALATYAYLQTN